MGDKWGAIDKYLFAEELYLKAGEEIYAEFMRKIIQRIQDRLNNSGNNSKLNSHHAGLQFGV